MKKFYTLALTLLTLGSTATPALADDDFETVSSITESGWYRMRLVKSAQKTTVSESAPLYVTTTLDEFKQTVNTTTYFYPFKLESAESTTDPITNFVYVGVSGSDYTIKSSNGHYAGGNASSYATAQNLALTAQTSLGTDAFQIGTAWDAFGNYVGKYSSSASKAAFQFATADVDNYDIWTVNILYAPSGSTIMGNAMVSTTNTANQGFDKVYNNGNFFFTKGATVSESDFSVENIDGYKAHLTLDQSSKTIYVYCSYDNENLIEGHIYTIKNVQSGTEYILGSTDGSTQTFATAATTDGGQYFVCHKEANGQYVFVNVKSGNYLSYQNNKQDKDGLSESCGAKQKLSLISTASTLANSFIIYSDVRADKTTTKNIYPIAVKSGSIDAWEGSNVCNTSSASNLFTFEEVTEFTYNTVKMQTKGDKSYASVYLPYAYNLPDGVDAYYATDVNTGDGTTLTMQKIDGTVVPKATAVVLCGTEASESVVSASTTQPDAVDGNKLSGTIADATVTSGKTTYAFSGKFDTIGFYKYTGENLPKGKAYLELDSTSGEANCLVLNFDGTTTGISGILTPETSAMGTYYDLSGRKVANPSHGLYIVNGKKVIL